MRKVLVALVLISFAAGCASTDRKGLLAEITTLAECQTIADLIALSTGPDTPPRALHALLLALFAVRSQGSLCLPLTVLETELAPFCAGRLMRVAAQPPSVLGVGGPANVGAKVGAQDRDIHPINGDAAVDGQVAGQRPGSIGLEKLRRLRVGLSG